MRKSEKVIDTVTFEARAKGGIPLDKPHIVFEAHPAHHEYFHLITVPMKKARRKKWWGKKVRVTVELIEDVESTS